MSDLASALRTRWAAQMKRLGWADGQAAIDGIILAYSEPHRRYHGLSHLAYIFTALDRHEASLTEPARCWMAAWYHDIIYNPRAKDNEAQSADRAVAELPGLGADTALVDRIAGLIRATANHQSGGSDFDDALFLDIDFSILGAPDAIYDAYTRGIREEYSWAPGLLYRQGRRAFLKPAQAAARTFLTDLFEDRIGEQARANMRREFLALGGKLRC
ncbi:N-methyl-D-aspartate receptor NMDAR2C subunit [Maricaulis sp.]|uniref:HD domain-containing protein n=1 Tax=Maricaulis sp. TaxID=1486257 RepID=UPI003A95679E